MIPVKIDTPTSRHSHFNKEESKEGYKCNTDLVDETKYISHIRKFTAKLIEARRYKSKVIHIEM